MSGAGPGAADSAGTLQRTNTSKANLTYSKSLKCLFYLRTELRLAAPPRKLFIACFLKRDQGKLGCQELRPLFESSFLN